MIKITKQPPQAEQIIILTPAELFREKMAWHEQKAKFMIWGDSGFFLK